MALYLRRLSLADWFEGLALTRDVTRNTITFTGDLPDQSALHGALARLEIKDASEQ
jgi:hypothetical protein